MSYVYDTEFIRSQKNQNVIIESLQTDMGTAQADITTLQDTKGDTASPAANTADYIPQWDGADSKTLKNGLALDTDGTLAANSDTKIPSQKAVKTLVSSKAKCAIFGSSLATQVTAGSTVYISYGVGNTAYEPAFVMPYAGTIKNLYVYTTGAPGTGKSLTFTMMIDNSASTLTCAISGAASNNAGDATHAPTVAVNQRVSLRAVSGAGAASQLVQFGFELDPS